GVAAGVDHRDRVPLVLEVQVVHVGVDGVVVDRGPVGHHARKVVTGGEVLIGREGAGDHASLRMAGDHQRCVRRDAVLAVELVDGIGSGLSARRVAGGSGLGGVPGQVHRVATGDGPPVLRAGDVRDHTGDLPAVIAHHGHRDLPGLGVTVAGIGVVHDVGHRGGVAQIGRAVLARDDLLGSIGVPVAVIGQTDVVPGQGVPQHVHSI